MDVPNTMLSVCHRGRREKGQGVEASAAGGEPGGVRAGRFRAAHEIQRCFGVRRSRVDADPLSRHDDNLGK